MLRRALRHLFTILSALSLLLCVAVLAFTANSWRTSDYFYHYRLRADEQRAVETTVSVIGHGGRLGLLYGRTSVPAKWQYILTPLPDGWSRGRNTTIAYFGRPADYADWTWRGYGYHVGKDRNGRLEVRDSWSCFLIAPWWLVAAVFAVAPALWLAAAPRARRRRRRAAGQCVSCGYDLRAHAAGEACPECGTILKNAR